MVDDYTGWWKVSQAARMFGFGVDVEKMIRDGELRYVKPDRVRFIEPASLEAALARRSGVQDAVDASRRIAALQGEIDQLKAAAGEHQASLQMAAREALAILSLEECLDICVYCGRRPPDVELHVDHVVPVAKGGSNELHNLVAACRDCNLGKHAKELAPAEVEAPA